MTLHDVAREAGVSPATVDRVLNGRDGVRSRTRDVVLGTARRLGYISDPAAPEVQAAVQLVFLLPAGTNAFIDALHRQIEAAAATRPELAVTIERIEGFNPQTLANRLADLRGAAAGVGLIAQDHPVVRESIRALAQTGIHVVTLASDIQNVPRLAYVGIDNRQAGRLAGQLVGRLLPAGKPAKAALFAGSLSYRGHEEREMGFRHILRDEFPHIQILELREIMDDRQKAVVETRALLDQHPDLAAIYNVGGGTAGIATELAARGVGNRVIVVSHEATDSNKRFLLDGTVDAVIDQNPRVEAREALNILTAAVRGEAYAYIPPRLQLILRENLPDE
ncbi:MAG: LacI family DNA-binding transcriptional regulator [Pseudomonadota bacterium]